MIIFLVVVCAQDWALVTLFCFTAAFSLLTSEPFDNLCKFVSLTLAPLHIYTPYERSRKTNEGC